jgi:hypothetical protein
VKQVLENFDLDGVAPHKELFHHRREELGVGEFGITQSLSYAIHQFPIHQFANSQILNFPNSPLLNSQILHFLVDTPKGMAAISAHCIQSTHGIAWWMHVGPRVQGKYVPGGTPDADEEKGKEKETLSG